MFFVVCGPLFNAATSILINRLALVVLIGNAVIAVAGPGIGGYLSNGTLTERSLRMLTFAVAGGTLHVCFLLVVAFIVRRFSL